MKILAFYLSRFLGVRILAVLCALTALLVLKDLIENVQDVLDRRGSGLDLLVFVHYRVPTVVESVLPISFLIGSVLGLRALSLRSEIVALWSAGISKIKLFTLCLPFCILVAICHYFVAGKVVPDYEKGLAQWWQNETANKKVLWFNNGDNFVRIEKVSQNGTVLRGLSIFLDRQSDGGLTKITASEAVYRGKEWLLTDVETISGTGDAITIEQNQEAYWSSGPTPENLVNLVSEPAHLTNTQLKAIASERWSSSLQLPVYRTELAQRLVVPLSSLLMLVLAVLTVRGQSRDSGPQVSAAMSIALGLSFLVAEGFFTAMGRTGLLAAELAAWSPFLVFSVGIGIAMVRYER